MPLTIAVDADSGGVARLRVAGELVIEFAEELQAAVEDCLGSQSCNEVRVNLAEVTFCDSVGLAALLIAGHACEHCGVSFVLEQPQLNVHRVVTLTGLKDVFHIES